MAMLPFCGYNMGDYFAHYLNIGKNRAPAFLRFSTSIGFGTDENGKFLWPGYGENSRVLKWIFERCDNKVNAVETPIGRLPAASDLDMKGLELPRTNLDKLLSVDVAGWLAEVPLIREHFAKFGKRLPAGLKQEIDDLERRLRSAAKN